MNADAQGPSPSHSAKQEANETERDESQPRRRSPVRSQLFVAVLCVLLGFAIVAQVRQTQGDQLATMRQEDLVRLLDEISQRNEALALEGQLLREDRAALLSGADASRSAAQYLLIQSILAGTTPVEGPGIVVSISQTQGLRPRDMVHMLEELRNAGAEAIELNGVRIVASSYFVANDGVLQVDGVQLGQTQEWRVIGNAETLAGALEIPGGALAGFRAVGAEVDMTQRDLVQVTAIRILQEPAYARPAPENR